MLAASLAGTPLGQRLIGDTNALYIKRKEQSGKWDELQQTCDELDAASGESVTPQNLATRLVDLPCLDSRIDLLIWFESRELEQLLSQL